MDCIINGVTATGLGEYDFTGPAGERYRFVDLYDDERGAIVRLSLAKDCDPPAVSFGTKLDLVCEVGESEKIVRGEERDRAMRSVKLRVTSAVLSKSQSVRAAA